MAMPSENSIGLLATRQLTQLTRYIEEELRRREIAKLLEKECQCDRYTCSTCQGLQSLHYVSGEEKTWPKW